MSEWVETGRAALSWWRRNLDVGDRASGRARALRARLRRADGIVEVLSEPEVHDLNAALPEPVPSPHRLALLARSLAHVDAHDQARLARRFGQRAGEVPLLSDLRFQRLVRTAEPEHLAAPLIRALPIAGRRCDVAALAADLVWWTDQTRARWCFEYYGGAVPARLAPEPETEDETEEAEA